MVERQIRSRGIHRKAVLDAMLRVERHRFVPEDLRDQAYADHPLPIGRGQTISQPYIVALMTELAEVASGDRVLEIGTGCGYQTAVLAKMGVEVFSVEIIPELAASAREHLEDYENIHLRVGDGYAGWPEAAPFDAILVAAAPHHIPTPLMEQLRVGGRLVIPVGEGQQELTVVARGEHGYVREHALPVRFVPMTGRALRED